MVQKLRRGSFFGRAEGRYEVSGIVLLESVYLGEPRIPPHEHASAFFDLITGGTCTELIGGQSRARDTWSLAFHPAGEIHSSRWLRPESRCFHVEIPRPLFTRMRQESPACGNPAHFRDGTAVWLAKRLHHEFHAVDAVSPLAIEGLTLELLAECARPDCRSRDQVRPRWLVKVRESLHDGFLEPWTLTSIADCAGVHPAHLARVFRRVYRCTLGEYVRKLRFEHCCRLLADSDHRLVDIGLSAGYCDQSHFSRSFKRHVGISPAEFRKLVRPRKSDPK
jgi:AraC family transcriptional regulator